MDANEVNPKLVSAAESDCNCTPTEAEIKAIKPNVCFCGGEVSYVDGKFYCKSGNCRWFIYINKTKQVLDLKGFGDKSILALFKDVLKANDSRLKFLGWF